METELAELSKVSKIKASLSRSAVEVTGDFGAFSPGEIASLLSQKVEGHGYKITLERAVSAGAWSEFKYALSIAIVFALAFFLLQKAGIVNFVSVDDISYGTAFVIGIIASLSTCMAVVGGVLLSVSATYAKEGDRTKPQILFHIGRIVSFFIFGGIIGSLGSAFALNATGTFVLSLIVGIVMLVLGLNLLDVLSITKKFQPAMPRFISERALGISKWNHRLTPLLIGAATFFLPCGFTQSMQIFTLSTGSFMEGALTMLVFALGTLPVLALISFSSFKIGSSSKSGIFFKTAGIIVILFALMNILASFAAIGVIPPLLNI